MGASPQVPEMKKPVMCVMCNWCAWHCAEPRGPRVNITWQCEKRERKGSFWSLIHLSPVTDKAGGVGGWKDDFSLRRARGYTTASQYRLGETETDAPRWNRRIMLNVGDYKRIFLWKGRVKLERMNYLSSWMECFTHCVYAGEGGPCSVCSFLSSD